MQRPIVDELVDGTQRFCGYCVVVHPTVQLTSWHVDWVKLPGLVGAGVAGAGVYGCGVYGGSGVYGCGVYGCGVIGDGVDGELVGAAWHSFSMNLVPKKFTAMEHWFDEAETNAMPGAIMYLVGSKMDKTTFRVVTYEEGEALAKVHGSQFCEVSSKTRENVRKPFVEIVDEIVRHPQLLTLSSRRSGTVTLGEQASESGWCAC